MGNTPVCLAVFHFKLQQRCQNLMTKMRIEDLKSICDPREAILKGSEQEYSTQKLLASWASMITR